MLYVLRNKSDRKLLGLFYAESPSALWNTIDEETNPYDMEFCEVETSCGGVWFEEVTDDAIDDDEFDVPEDQPVAKVRYPVVDQVTFNEDVDAALFDAYQEFINNKDGDELEWQQFDRRSYGRTEFTRDILYDACGVVESES